MRLNPIPSTPFNTDSPTQRTFAMPVNAADRDNESPTHHHNMGQLVLALRGGVTCSVPQGLWMVPPQCGVWIPGGMPHAIENMGRQAPAVLLDLFAPMGPEKVYRDPKDPAGRAAFEVIREAAPAAPPGAHYTVASPGETLPVFGGKVKVRPLLEPAKTANPDLYVGLLEGEPGGCGGS